MFQDDVSNDQLLASYQKITDKLKRRKPNYGEAVTEYSTLMQQLKRAGAHQYIAFCCLAVARCHQAQRQIPQQAQELQTADDSCIFLTEFYENVEQAMHCYMLAIHIYTGMKKLSLASALYHEMGSCLKFLRRYKEAAKEFRKAAELHQLESAISAINSLFEAFSCDIECHQFSESFKNLQWIVKLSTEEGHESNSMFFLDKKVEALVSTILVLLLLEDTAQARLTLKLLKREHGNYSGSHVQIYHTTEWFFLLIDEVITEFHEHNEEELNRIHAELYSCFTPIQNRIYLLLMEYSRPQECKVKKQ